MSSYKRKILRLELQEVSPLGVERVQSGPRSSQAPAKPLSEKVGVETHNRKKPWRDMTR